MTSSLVGSEMCIRDSPCTRYSTYVAVAVGIFAATHTGANVQVAVCEEPVSYTHLTLPTICSV
eukprot:632187-Prorocentrum_lima.AAC.1